MKYQSTKKMFLYLFHNQFQFGIEGLGFFQILVELREVTKVHKLLHLQSIAFNILQNPLAPQLEMKSRHFYIH